MNRKNFFTGLLATTFIFVISSFSLLNAQDLIITKNELPKEAQTFINQYFKNSAIGYIKKDNDFYDVDYEVVFTDRTEIDFDKNGNWEQVDGEGKAIPTGFIPSNIVSYVNKNFSGVNIIKIDKERYKYEVKLSNGLELEFDTAGNFMRYDD